jgi:hypothetical protein
MLSFWSRCRVALRSTLRRPVVALLVALTAFGATWVSDARADSTVSMYAVTYSGYTSRATSATAACTGMNAYPAGWGGGVWGLEGSCVLRNSGSFVANVSVTQVQWCASGTAPNTSLPADQQCGAPPPSCTDASVASKYVGAWVVGGGSTGAPNYACIQGCQYPQGSFAAATGNSYGMEVGKGNGQTCTGANYDTIDTTTKKDDPPSLISCGQKGKTYGTVNGVGICADAGTVPGSTVTQNGSSSTTPTSASGVAGGTSTTNTTTTVTNNGGSSSVTTTTTNPDGSKTQTTQDKDTFCSQNPNSAICKQDGTASGGDDCVTPPVCTGDAVQCMMVKQQWGTRCDNQKANTASALGALMVNGNDPVSSPASAANRTVIPISSQLDQSAFLGGGGLSDKVFTVSGQAITFPFSRLNQYLEWLGRLFVVMSLIGALRIVLGGFK